MFDEGLIGASGCTLDKRKSVRVVPGVVSTVDEID